MDHWSVVRRRWAVAGKEQWPLRSCDAGVWGSADHRQHRAPSQELVLPSIGARSAQSSRHCWLDVPWPPVLGAPLCCVHGCQRQHRGKDPAPHHLVLSLPGHLTTSRGQALGDPRL